MTIFGVDLSSNNVDAKGNRVSLADCQAQGYDFVTARCIQEGKVKDPEYDGFHADAKAAGLLFAAYVFPWTGVPVTDTAHAAAAAIGEFDIPIMIDWENEGSSVPSFQFA